MMLNWCWAPLRRVFLTIRQCLLWVKSGPLTHPPIMSAFGGKADTTEALRPSDFLIYGLFNNASRKIFFISPSKILKVYWSPAEAFGDDRFRDFRRGFLGARLPIFLGERAILDSSLFSLLVFSLRELFFPVSRIRQTYFLCTPTDVAYWLRADIRARVAGRNLSKIGGTVPRLNYSGRPALRRPSSMPSKLWYLDRGKILRSRSIVRSGSSSSSLLSADLASSMRSS